MVALSALVSGLDAELVRLGYKDATMVWYRRCWRRMQEHFVARGVEEFSLDAAMAARSSRAWSSLSQCTIMSSA